MLGGLSCLSRPWAVREKGGEEGRIECEGSKTTQKSDNHFSGLDREGGKGGTGFSGFDPDVGFQSLRDLRQVLMASFKGVNRSSKSSVVEPVKAPGVREQRMSTVRRAFRL